MVGQDAVRRRKGWRKQEVLPLKRQAVIAKQWVSVLPLGDRPWSLQAHGGGLELPMAGDPSGSLAPWIDGSLP